MSEKVKLNLPSRILLSLWILFHLYAVTLAPEIRSYVGTRSSVLIEPYLHFFGLTASWAFFAPEPLQPISFIEWELFDSSGNSIEVGRLPESPDPYFFRERQNRRLTLTKGLYEDDVRTEKFLLHYLCGRNQNVASVQAWNLYHDLPSMSEVANGVIRPEVKEFTRRLIFHSFCLPRGDK